MPPGLFETNANCRSTLCVLRLLVPAIHRRRKRLFGSVHRSSMGRLLLRSAETLDFGVRAALERALAHHAELAGIDRFKEKLQELWASPTPLSASNEGLTDTRTTKRIGFAY